MLPLNHEADPIVQILRLAYRRGLALRQEQEKSQVTNKELPHVKPIEKPDSNAISESNVQEG
jgi:hypothetical protein